MRMNSAHHGPQHRTCVVLWSCLPACPVLTIDEAIAAVVVALQRAEVDELFEQRKGKASQRERQKKSSSTVSD